jgi:AraC-like DNA-binding protein
MITIGEMQISGMLTMMILSVMLVMCVPGRSIRHGSFARARLMMAAGTGLIAVQFLLQYIYGFRQMGVTQAVLFNLLFFTPASLLCGMSILYMQRQGDVITKEWATVWSIYALSAIILIGTVLSDGIPLREESEALRVAEYVGAMLYAVMQSYIFKRQYMAYKQLEQAVDEYYDRERRDLFGWMGLSMKAMALLAFLVPVVIFLNGTPLVLFSIAYFFSISYSTISLYSYGISEDVTRVEEAEGQQEGKGRGEKPAAAAENYAENVSLAVENVASAVEKWKATGAYREHSLTLGVVAHQMGLPQKQLQEWLRQSEYKKLAGMVATFRIEEAQRVLKEHPDWSVESVAEHCGFNDRKYFHSTFRNVTGMTPANYQRKNS